MQIVIEGVKQRPSNYGMVANEVWYNGKGQCPVAKGDTVELEFEVNAKGYKDITKIVKLAGPAVPSGQQAPLQPQSMSGSAFVQAPQPINGMELGLALKQAQQVQTAQMMADKEYNFNWEQYKQDVESFFSANKGIKATIIQKQI